MLGITFSPQIYHIFFSLGFKFKENNENDMTFVVWAVIVFGPRVWQLSARCHYVLRGTNLRWRFRKILWPSQKYIKFYLNKEPVYECSLWCPKIFFKARICCVF